MDFHHTKQSFYTVAKRQTVKSSGTTEINFQSSSDLQQTVGTEEHPPMAGGFGSFKLPQIPFMYLPYENFRARLDQQMTVSYRAHIYDSYPGLPASHRRYDYVYTGNFPNLWMPAAVLPSRECEAELINACYQAIADKKVDLGVMIAELNDTVSLIGRTASRISSAIFAIKKGRFKKAANILRMRIPKGVSRSKHWSDNYLAYQFGIIPLISDVCSLAEHMAVRGKERELLTVRARIPRSTTVKSNVMTTGWATDPGTSLVYHYSSRIEDSHEVVLKFNVGDEFWRELAQLGLLNPFSLKWDTIPLSFVVDWFSTIGTVLDACSALYGLRFRTGGYMRMQKILTTYNFRGVSFRLDSYQRLEGQTYTQLQEGVHRSVAQRRETYSEMPPPALYFKIPFGNGLGRAVTAVALGRQRLS